MFDLVEDVVDAVEFNSIVVFQMVKLLVFENNIYYCS